MDKKIKIGVAIGVFAIVIFMGVAMRIKPTKEDKTGEDGVIKEVKNKEGEAVEIIRYSDEYQSQLDYMYEQVTKDKNTCIDFDVQTVVHWMSNSTIKAKGNARRGFIEPNPKNIDKLITIVQKSNPTNKNFYEKTLKEWLNGNFIDAKELHNKAWTCLDGDIGKATGPDENRINTIKKEHFEK